MLETFGEVGARRFGTLGGQRREEADETEGQEGEGLREFHGQQPRRGCFTTEALRDGGEENGSVLSVSRCLCGERWFMGREDLRNSDAI